MEVFLIHLGIWPKFDSHWSPLVTFRDSIYRIGFCNLPPGSGLRDPGSEFIFPNLFLWDKRYTDIVASRILAIE